MSLALESVCNALGLHSDDEAARIRVAEKIIELAQHGMRGATLHATAAKEFEADRNRYLHIGQQVTESRLSCFMAINYEPDYSFGSLRIEANHDVVKLLN
jgi:hypothetical protein